MALNVPAGNKKRLTFGPAILKMGAALASGLTPTVLTDIGYVRSATYSVTRRKLDVLQGSPETLIETFAIGEDVSLNITSIEVNPFQFYFALGSGVTTTGAGIETLEFGGQVTFAEVGLNLIHKSPTEGTVELWIWRAQPVGEISLPFGSDIQEIAFNFRALEALTQWNGTSTGTNKRLSKLNFTPNV